MATAMKSVIAAAVLAFYFVPVEMTPRYKLCADNKCNSPISQVRALDNYDHQDPAFISFKKDNVITIYGKEETDNPQGLWFGESSEKPGKRGFFVQSAVREETIFNRKPSVKVRIHIQDTGEDTQPPDSPGRRQIPESKHHGLGMSQPEIPDSTTDVLTEGNTDAVTQTAATFTITETDTNTENDKIPMPDLQSASDIITQSASDVIAQSAGDIITQSESDTSVLRNSDTDTTNDSELNTQSASELDTLSADEPNTQSLSDTQTESDSEQRDFETDTTSDSELNTQSASELDTINADELNTQSLSDTQTESDSEQRDSDADIRSDSELNTQSASELNTQSASEPNTQSLSDTHTQSESDSELNIQSASELNLQSASELNTLSASELNTQSAREPNTQSLSDTHTQSESDATIHYSTDIPTYDESNEVNQHQEVVSDSELNPQVVFSEEYTLVLEPVPHSETETNPQEIDVVSSKLDLQTTEEDIHDGNTLVHEVPHVEPEPETHLEVDANSEMLTDTGTNMDSVETDDSDSDNSLGVSHGKIPNTETDSESTTDAGSRANAHLNEIHSDTDAEPSSQITDDSVQDSEQWQTSDDPENIHDLTGNLERNIYSAKNSHTNLVAPNETNTIEENDLQPKNGQPTVSESFLQHHVSTEGTQIEANAIRPQTDLPTEVGTAGDAHQYKTALEIDSTEPEEEHGKLHFEESSKSETTSNMPDERQSDYTNNVELVEETLPVQPQVAAVTENDYQERVSQSRDDRGDDIPLDEQSSLDLSDVEMIENYVEREVTAPEEENESGLSDDEINENDEERDVTAPEEENEAPLSDEMKKLMNHKIVRRKGPRHDIIDEEDEENFLSGVFSAREHHIMHWERNKEEEDSEETKKLKEKKHRKGEKIDHEGSGMERAEAIQPLGSNNYSPRKVEIDMQLIERQIITDSIPVEEKERVQSRKLRKTRVNIEYDLRQHRDEMRGEYLDEEEEELEEEEEESNEKLHPGRNEYGRTVMTMDMSPSIEYGWGGALTNDGHSQGRTTSSQEDDIPTSNLHMSGASSLDQNTVEPQEGVDLVGLPSGTTIDESTNVAEETHREDVDSEGEEIGNEVEGMSGSDQEGKQKGRRSSDRGKCYLCEHHRWLWSYRLSTSNSSHKECPIRTMRTDEKPSGRCHLRDYFKWMEFYPGSSAQNVCLAKKGNVARVDSGSHGGKKKKKKHRMNSTEVCFQEERHPWLVPSLNRDNILMCRDTLYQAFEQKNNFTGKTGVTRKGKYGKCLLKEYHTWLLLLVRLPQECGIPRLSEPPRSKSGKCLLGDYYYWLNYSRRCPMMPEISRKLPVQLSASNQKKCSVEDYYVWLRYKDKSSFCTARQGSSANGTTLKIPRVPRKCRLHRYFPFFSPTAKKISTSQMDSSPQLKTESRLRRSPKCRAVGYLPIRSRYPSRKVGLMSENHHRSGKLPKCKLHPHFPFFRQRETAKTISSSKKCLPSESNARNHFRRSPKCRAAGYLTVKPRNLSCKARVFSEKQQMKKKILRGKCRLHKQYPYFSVVKTVCKANFVDSPAVIKRGKQRFSKKCKADLTPFGLVKQRICSARLLKVFAATPRVKMTNAKCRLHESYPFLIRKRSKQCMVKAEMQIIKSKRFLAKCWMSKHYPFLMKESICKAKSITAVLKTLKQKRSKRVSKCHLHFGYPFLLLKKAPTCSMRRFNMKIKKTEAKLGKCRAVGYQPVQPRHLSCKVLTEKWPVKRRTSFGKCRLHQYYPLLLITEAVCKAKIEDTSLQIERGKRWSGKKCKAVLNPFQIIHQQVCSIRFRKVSAAAPRVKKTTAKCRLHTRYPFLIQKRPNQCMEAETHIIKSKRFLAKCLLPKHYPFAVKVSICKAKSISAVLETLKQKRSKRVSKCHLHLGYPFLLLQKAPVCSMRRSNTNMKVKKTKAKLGKCRAVGYLPVQLRHLSCKVLTEKWPMKRRTSFGKCRLHQYYPLLLITEAVCKAKIEDTSIQIERGKRWSGKKCKAVLNPFQIIQQQVCSIRFRKVSAATPRVKKTTAKCRLHKRYSFLILKRPNQCMEAETHIIKSKHFLAKCWLSKHYPFVVKESICKAKSITAIHETLKQKRSKSVSKCHLHLGYPFLLLQKDPTCSMRRFNTKVKKTEAKPGKCRAVGYLPVQLRHLSCKVLTEKWPMKRRTSFEKCRLHQYYPLLLITEAVCKAKIEDTSIQIERDKQRSGKKCKAVLNPFKLIQQHVCGARLVKVSAATPRVKNTTAKCRLHKRYPFLIQKRPNQCMEAETHIIKSKRFLAKCWLSKHYPFVVKESICKAKSITAIHETLKQKRSKSVSKCHLHLGYPFLLLQKDPTCSMRRFNTKVKKTEAKLGKCRAVGYLPVQLRHLSCKVLTEKWPMKRRTSFEKCRLHQYYPLLLITEAVCKAKIEDTSIQIERDKQRSGKKCKAVLNPFKLIQQHVCGARLVKVSAATPRVKNTTAKCRLHKRYPFLIQKRPNQCMEAETHIIKSKRFLAKCLLPKHPFMVKEYICKAKLFTAVPETLKQKRSKRVSKCHLHLKYPFLFLQDTATCRMGRATIKNRTKKTDEKPCKCRAIPAPFLPVKLPTCIMKPPTGNNIAVKLSQCRLNVRYPFLKLVWQNLRESQCMDNRTDLEQNEHKSSINLSKCRVPGRYPFLKGRNICKAKPSTGINETHINHKMTKAKLQKRARRCRVFERFPFMLVNQTATCKIRKAVGTVKLKGAKQCRVKTFPLLPVKQPVCKSSRLILPAANKVKRNGHKCRPNQRYSFLKEIQRQSKPRQCMDNSTTTIQILKKKNVTKKCRRPRYPFSTKETVCTARPLSGVVKESALLVTSKRARRCVQPKGYPFITEQQTAVCRIRTSEKPTLILPTGCKDKMKRCKCRLRERYSFLIQAGSQLKARQCALNSKTKEQFTECRNRKKCRRSKRHPFLVRQRTCQSRSPTEGTRKSIQRQTATRTSKCWLHKVHPFIPFRITAMCKTRRSYEVQTLLPDRSRDGKGKTPHCKMHDRYHFLIKKALTCRVKKLVDKLSADNHTAQFSVPSSKCQLHKAHPFLRYTESVCQPMLIRLPSSKVKRENKKITQIRKCLLTKRFPFFWTKMGVCKPRMVRSTLRRLFSKNSNGHGRYCRLGKLYPFMENFVQPKMCKAKTFVRVDSRAQVATLKIVRGKVSKNAFPHLVEQYSSISKRMCMAKGFESQGVQNKHSGRTSRATPRKTSSRRIPAFIQSVPKKMPVCFEKSGNAKESVANQSTNANASGSSLKQKCSRYKPQFLRSVSNRMSQCFPRSGQRKQALDVKAPQPSANASSDFQQSVSRNKLVSKDPIVMVLSGTVLIPTANKTRRTQGNQTESNSIWSSRRFNSDSKGRSPKCKARSFPKIDFTVNDFRLKCKPTHFKNHSKPRIIGPTSRRTPMELSTVSPPNLLSTPIPVVPSPAPTSPVCTSMPFPFLNHNHVHPSDLCPHFDPSIDPGYSTAPLVEVFTQDSKGTAHSKAGIYGKTVHKEKTTKKNPVATDDDQIIYRGTGKTVPKVNHEHNENTISREQRQAENEETDEQTNAENNRSQEKGIDEEEEDKVDAVVEDESQNHLKERKDEDLKEDNSEEPHERGASSNGESPQDDRQEADPDIEVIDGTTIYLSDMLPTPLSDEIRSQITPTPTPGAEHASIPAPILNSQEMDLNPTRSTGHKAPDREQDEKWVVVQNSKNSPNHQHIEDQHSKFLREAQNFMKTRSTENMSPQMGKVVKDLMRKGILEGGSKEETPNQDSKPSGETQDGPHKSDDDNLKDSVAEDDSEIVMPSAPDLDSEKVQNFFKQLMTLPQFSKQPQKALQELNKYIENPSTRVGLTKNEYQIKRLQEKEDKLKKSPEKEKMGEEQTSEDQGDRETGSKSPTEELEESDPEKLLRDGQRSHDDLADGDAYLQAQEEETRREKESHRKKGDEGDANDDVVQDDQRDTYASQAESSQEDVEQFVDPARLLREREEQDDQNVVEVEDGQLEINRDENGENGQDMPKDNQENGDQTERDPPEDMAPANNNILDEIADQIDEILQSNLNGEPDLDVILEQGNTAPSPDDFERGVSSPSEENEPEKEASHQDPLLNIQGDEEMNGLTDEEVPRVDSTSSEHSRSEEMHQEIEELFAGLDAVDAPNREGIPDADKRPDESNEEPPEVSGPPLTEDSYLGEMRRMESTVHTPVEEQGKYENMYDADEKKEVPPSDAGTVSEGEHSETQTQAKDDETTDPYLEEIVESTPTPPVPSHGQVADAKDRQEGDNPSGTGRIFEGGNSEIHSEVAVEVEVEEEADEGIPSRFNRRVPLGLDEGNGFSDQGFLAANDTFGEDHWTMAGINILKPVLVAINTSLQPLMEFLPDDVQLALHGADFLGIPWPVLIVIELISCAVFSFLLCVCFCSCRNPKAFNSSMLDEIEALHGQKADILDTLDMTTMQFKAQNRHYYELKRNGDKNLKERNKLSQSCKELKSKIQTLEKELSLIQSASGQNEKQLTATQQQVDLYEEQVSTASQTIAALQQQVQDLEGSLHDCATTIGVLKQEKQSLSEQNQLLTSTKEQQSEEISGWNERVSEMNEQVELLHNEKKDLEESVTYKDNEIEVLKDYLLQLKGLEADDDEPENDKEAKVHQLMDVTRVSAKLSLVEGEKTELEAKYEAEVRGRRELEAKVGAQQQEVDTAKAGYKTAKSSLDEAQTKLDVMTEYFRNKEVDLQRKLGREEALRLHSDSKLENADEKAATAEVEVTNYRTQIKDLKEELVKAERNYRNQVAAHEKKAHDSWMSVRNAERELQEAKREAATLRHRLTELEGRRAKSEAAPLFKPSPSGREGSPPPTKLGAPSRNSLLADTPSPPRLDQSRALSPGRPMYPGDHPPSPPADNDLAPYRHSTRSGRDSGPPPPFPDDGGPPPHMRRDMDYPPLGRLPPPGRHSRGPPMHDMSYDPHDMRDFSPDGPPPDFGFDPHGPPPPDMDFGPHGPPFNGPPPPLRHPFPPRDFPPHPDDFDHRGPPPDDRDFGPPMDDREFGPPRGYGPPPPGMDFGPMGPPPPLGGPMHGPGPFPNDMGPPPMDRREPPPPLGRSGPSPGPRNPGIRPNIHGQFPPQTGPSPSGNFPPSGPTFGTPTGPQRRTSTPLEGTPVTPQTRPSLRPAQGP